jgi:hypothetical protein
MSHVKEFRVYRCDDGIMVFEFLAMNRAVADAFAKVVRVGAGSVPSKLRVIYDFSLASPPTPYFLQIQAKLYNEFPHPADEKSAYVVGTSSITNEVWVRILRSRLTAADTMRIFTSVEDALVWLAD